MNADPMANPAHPHPRFAPWIGDLVAAALIIVAAIVPFPEAEFHAEGLAEILLVAAPAVILPFRRRWPIPVLAICLVLYGIAAACVILSPGIVLATAIAMFGVANRSTRRVTLIVASSAVVAVLVLSLLATIGAVFDPRTFQFAVVIAFASAAGDATRSRREYIVAITERAVRAEETREAEAKRRVTDERLRIARDLHDAVAHQIAVISLNAGVASSAVDARPEQARAALATIRSAARTVLGEIGDLLEVLRAETDDGERPRSPQPGLDRLDDLVRQFGDAGLTVNVRVDGDIGRLDGASGLVAYRVIQEGLTNAHKHGAEARAHVLVDVGDDAALVVVSNPVLPAAARLNAAEARSGHGLLGLRERVASVRGSIETGLTPGGYRLAATLPLASSALDTRRENP
ncbi:sensor histidine kinase [Agromyces atrinae]|uniref:histidine kinase n=1 Tax=Agromyces atrinae TaxID=592376 RepID=A0A4Q2MFG9_9MICO|nr:histidine kinase [Agromyces atrinae]NYD67924.1 signal transduction histidine kinase [Agromyces atrinae]RXZ87910.1 sensor histidine kinase [Agromyces atrinae]